MCGSTLSRLAGMTTELVLLGTAAAPMPVAGRGGIASALVVGNRVFVIDCGRGAPSAFVTPASIFGAWTPYLSPTSTPTTSVIFPACLGYLERHGTTGAELERMAGLHTDVAEVGGVAERAGVKELILTHYLPAEPGAIGEAEWVRCAAPSFRGKTIAGHDGLRRVLP